MSDHNELNMPAELWLRHANSMVAFAPSEGCCCTAFRVQHQGEWIKVFAEPSSWDVLRARPAFFGNPLLFPFPYGIKDGSFEYRGQSYLLQPGREGRVQHGVVRDYPWAVERIWDDEHGAHLQALTDNVASDKLAQFPFPFRFSVTHTLQDSALTYQFEAKNIGSAPMPMGLGIHPYFPLPYLAGRQAADCLIYAQVSYTKAFAGDPGQPFVPVSGVLDLRAGQRVDALINAACPAGKSLLVLYAMSSDPEQPVVAEKGAGCSLRDAGRGFGVEIEVSKEFPFLLFFAPPSRAVLSPVISTCLPGAFSSLGQGRKGGIVELMPGETWRAWARIGVRSI